MSDRTRARAYPVRTCVGCRVRSDKRELLRVALVGGRCVPDLRGTLRGRGAYLHPASACLEQAVRRKAFHRAFRGPGPFDTAELREHLTHLTEAGCSQPATDGGATGDRSTSGTGSTRGTSEVAGDADR